MRSMESKKDSAQEDTIVVSATMGMKVADTHQRPLILQRREQKRIWKNLQEESQRSDSILEVDSKDVQRLPQRCVHETIA